MEKRHRKQRKGKGGGENCQTAAEKGVVVRQGEKMTPLCQEGQISRGKLKDRKTREKAPWRKNEKGVWDQRGAKTWQG